MSLSVESRSCGKAYVIKCFGRISAGEESRMLEAALMRALQDSNRIVLNVAEVSRIDSSGMGLLVRFMSRLRGNGGDMRLAELQPFFQSLLDTTKLSTLLKIYRTEEEAIVSFLKEPGSAAKQGASAGPLVLFLDQSADLCAFVKNVLNRNGFEVITTCRLHDAKLLVSAADVSFVVLGPDCAQVPCETVLATLKPFAKAATFVSLASDFKLDDIDKAASDLLSRLQSQGASA